VTKSLADQVRAIAGSYGNLTTKAARESYARSLVRIADQLDAEAELRELAAGHRVEVIPGMTVEKVELPQSHPDSICR
jgi:hypothetical protein